MSNLTPNQERTLEEVLKPGSPVARFSRKFDILVIPVVAFALWGAFHLHFMLTAGDWDFWVDWKDRQFWVTITPIMLMMIVAAVQAIFWTNFRLPIGATLCCVLLLLGEWIVRWLGFNLWSHFPIVMVWPAIILPGAILLDLMLMLVGPLLTGIIGSVIFALFFPLGNWYILSAYRVPIEIQGQMLTIADWIGFTFSRTATPEYLRMIERGTLRTFGGESTLIAAFFSGFVCIIMYTLWWKVGTYLSGLGWKNNKFKTYMGFKQTERVQESDGLGGPVGEVD